MPDMTPAGWPDRGEDSSELESIMKRLKTDTRSQHEALERTGVSRRVMSPALTQADYLKILRAFYTVFFPLENQVQSTLAASRATLQFLPRSPLAAADIRYLSGTFSHDVVTENKVKGLLSIPEAMGVMYVLEGSKLGGKIISRQLAKTIGVGPQEGGDFFAGGTIEEWKNFQKYCEAYAQQHPEHSEKIIASARATFKRIEEHFHQACSFAE